MTSTAKRVTQHLSGDLILEEALERGVLNLRRTARWLLETRGWETTEEAIVSALRRYETDACRPNVHEAHRHLAQARVNIEPGLALATYPRVRELQRRLPSFWWKVDGEDVLGLMSKPALVHFLLDKDTVDTLQETLGKGELHSLHHPVSEVRISLPEEPRLAPLSAAAMLNVFGHHEVDVLDILGCQPDISLLVPGDQGPHAYRTAGEFIETLDHA